MGESKPLTIKDAKKIDERIKKDLDVTPKVNIGGILSKIGRTKKKSKQ